MRFGKNLDKFGAIPRDQGKMQSVRFGKELKALRFKKNNNNNWSVTQKLG